MAQTTIRIPEDYSNIQSGIDAASEGDTVLVDAGTYYENINFSGKAITLASQHIIDGDTTHINNTIIDGSMAANPDSASVVYFINDEDTLSVLHGFTIQGGKGTIISQTRAGGGILGLYAGPKIECNRIRNNECTDAGGWASGGGITIAGSYNSIPVIRGNEISNNACYKIGNGTGVPYGGGISVEYSGDGYECLIENNIISNNKCSNEVQDQFAIGGGIYIDYLKATIVNNQIVGNQIISTDDYWMTLGAGIYAYGILDSSNISGNLIADNSTSSPFSAGAGLGIMENSGKVYIDRNIFLNDTARRGGGVALIDINDEVVFTNNVLKGNYATYQGGGLYIKEDSKKSPGYPKAAGGINKINKSGEKNKDAGIAVIANNTFIENSDLYEEATSIHFSVGSKPLIAFNNIFYNLEGGTGSEVFISEPGATAYLFNNLLDTVNNLICYGDWQGADNIVGDPLFTDDSCHLDWPSLCVNAGTDSLEVYEVWYHSPLTDIDGDARPFEWTKPDIGADEAQWYYVGIEEFDILGSKLEVQNHPNPFSTSTTITYELRQSASVQITIFNHLGQQVDYIQQNQSQGKQQISWNATGLQSGVYYFRLQTGEHEATGKLILLQ